jgi:hypothetical protein
MKKAFILLLAVALTSQGAKAATLFAGDTASGLTLSDGTTALASGAIRLGHFTSGFNFAANANDLAALQSAFTQVVAYTGAISAFEVNGFFDQALTYTAGGTYGSLPYDSSAASTSDVGGDIAGSKIYAWVLNNATTLSATQQAIFSTNQVWTDADTVPVNDSSVSWSAGTSGLTAHIGSLSTGADIGGGTPSHSLAAVAAIPEPSRAMLGFIGIAAMLFRRRRA